MSNININGKIKVNITTKNIIFHCLFSQATYCICSLNTILSRIIHCKAFYRNLYGSLLLSFLSTSNIFYFLNKRSEMLFKMEKRVKNVVQCQSIHVLILMSEKVGLYLPEVSFNITHKIVMPEVPDHVI